MAYDALKDLVQFLENSPTPWHAASEIGNRLAQQDYTPLEEQDKWNLEPGRGYFVERGGAICAFSLPRHAPKQAVILASHTDSPALKLKPNPVFIDGGLPFLRLETYGSPILSTWMNRDLVIAGRLLVSKGNRIDQQLVFLDHVPTIIPTLAIHLSKDANDHPKKIDKQHHLCPLLGTRGKYQDPKEIFEKLIGIRRSDLLGADLYLVPDEKPRFIGISGDLISSYRIDNLASAHASILALLGAENHSKEVIHMAMFWNHEEIGSKTHEGACSPFFLDTLKRIAFSYHIEKEEFLRLKQKSYLVSIDMAHAFHPGYKDRYDKENAPEIGKGIVIKHHANHHYATSGLTAAHMTKLCQKNHIPHQLFASHSNISCGSTVGAIANASIGIPTVDIGIAQFSMHAARELMSTSDHNSLCKLLKSILEEVPTISLQ